MEIMSATRLDAKRYRKLVSEALPAVIHTEAEYRRLLEIARELMERPDEELSREEGRLLELLVMVIEDYEAREYPLPQVEPARMLGYLMEEKSFTARDLADILPKSRLSEILNGKRDISKSQAKQLAERFRVSPELLLYGTLNPHA